MLIFTVRGVGAQAAVHVLNVLHVILDITDLGVEVPMKGPVFSVSHALQDNIPTDAQV